MFNCKLFVEKYKNMGKFKIKKEESSSIGVRRIKAVLVRV